MFVVLFATVVRVEPTARSRCEFVFRLGISMHDTLHIPPGSSDDGDMPKLVTGVNVFVSQRRMEPHASDDRNTPESIGYHFTLVTV